MVLVFQCNIELFHTWYVYWYYFVRLILGVRHVHVLCDGCGQDPIVGMRWHCLGCPNFDLCTTCYMTDQHNLHHPFERIDKTRAKGYLQLYSHLNLK